jgi:hypothetical protein
MLEFLIGTKSRAECLAFLQRETKAKVQGLNINFDNTSSLTSIIELTS